MIGVLPCPAFYWLRWGLPNFALAGLEPWSSWSPLPINQC
jgi:hypothetical protein